VDIPEADQQPLFTRRTSFGFRVNQLGRMLSRELAARIATHGVVPGQFAVLLALYDHDPQSVTELAMASAIEHPTVSRTLGRMERDGLIRRSPDPDDLRSRLVSLTDRGRSLEAQLKAAASSVNTEFLAPLSPGERIALLALLDRVIDARGTRLTQEQSDRPPRTS